MIKLELVINEVILKTKCPLPSNRRHRRTNHIFFLMYLFFLNIYLLECCIKHRCFLVLDRHVLNNRCPFSENDVSGNLHIDQIGQGALSTRQINTSFCKTINTFMLLQFFTIAMTDFAILLTILQNS